MSIQPHPRSDAERSELTRALEDLLVSRAAEARVTLQSGPIYLIFSRRRRQDDTTDLPQEDSLCGQDRDADTVEIEAISSLQLPPRHKLSSVRAHEMRALGFKKEGGRLNWKRRVDTSAMGPAALAAQSMDILERLYGAEEPLEISFVEDEREHPQNPLLHDAMRDAARRRDESTRHRLYNALVNTNFLVPLTGPPQPTQEISMCQDALEDCKVFEHEQGQPTYGVFTDWSALRRWQPQGWSYRTVHGSALFDALDSAGVNLLRINPDGDLGGELHRHEIEMLAAAVQQYRRLHAN